MFKQLVRMGIETN